MTTLTILDAKGETKTIETELSVYSIEEALRRYAFEQRSRHNEYNARKAREARISERRKIVAKLNKLGIKVKTVEGRYYSSENDRADLENKTYSGEVGTAYDISFPASMELKYTLALRGQTDLVFAENIVERREWISGKTKLVRVYTVTLPAQPEAE